MMKTDRGFTLVEMIVVISIFTIMTGVVLANLPQFRERTALQLVAQKMAITIREAQVYGVGVKSFGTEFPSHGIYFYPTTGASSNLKSYILFADDPSSNNNKYDPPNEKVTQYDLTGTVEIQTIETCSSSSSCPPKADGMNIVFDRPKTEANFTDPSSGAPISSASYANIIIVSNRSLETRTIQVWNTGQISVKSP